MPNLKEILIRNGYPEHIIDQKFLDFLCEPENYEKPEISFTLCVSYTSPQAWKNFTQISCAILFQEYQNMIPLHKRL
jgi:hypothetical protein